MNIFGLMRAAKSNMPMDAFPALLESMGIDAEVATLQAGQLPVAFQDAVRASQRSGADVVRMRGAAKDGSEILALIVIRPAQPEVLPAEKNVLTKALPSAL